MPTVTVEVVYQGHAPSVEGGGFQFPKGKRVKVPAEMAGTLGPDFKIVTSRKGDAG
jgi:hypothetical protein